jgi:hypothetical protein
MNKTGLICLFIVSTTFLIRNLTKFNIETNSIFYYLECVFDIFIVTYSSIYYIKLKRKSSSS